LTNDFGGAIFQAMAGAARQERQGQYPPMKISEACLLRGAEEAANEAAAVFRKSLLRNAAKLGLISPTTLELNKDLIESVVSDEKRKAISEHKEERAAGRRNNLRSEEPGITLFLTEAGVEQFLDFVKCEEVDTSCLPLEKGEVDQVADKLWMIYMDTGTFTVSSSPHSVVNVNFCGLERNRVPCTFVGEVVWVEGSKGELYKNPDYNERGECIIYSPKPARVAAN
jgi:hypothetical protein